MGARTLEARLTGRLLALAGAIILAVGAAAVAVTDRMLDASDTERARADAKSALDALTTELDEGDSFGLASREVKDESAKEGISVALARGEETAGDPDLPRPASGACATVTRGAEAWRACAAEERGASVVAAIPIGAHRAAAAALARGMVVVVGLGLVAMWLAIRRAIRAPLGELAGLVGWTSRIARSEAASDPPPAATVEIAQLEAAFDALVRRLLDAVARERANSAHIAHELRTPLTAVVAELDVVRPADEASRAALARVRGDVARFADVIEAILVLTSPRGRERITDRVVNVADVARELAPAGVVVEAPDEALVDGDERLVRLALRNLVDNATKYAGGARAIRVARGGGAVRLSVVDEGPGLDAAARGRMFDRYWRGAADAEGRGLGLALVRAVAERHGGAACAEAGAEGKGLEVSMTLGAPLDWHEG